MSLFAGVCATPGCPGTMSEPKPCEKCARFVCGRCQHSTAGTVAKQGCEACEPRAVKP